MKSFLQGKRALDIQSLRLPPAPVLHPVASCGAQPAQGATAAPQVELVKQGDKIMRIVITCTCGERTEIDCLYPPGQ